jgi:pimeloyl-ACP methyl ester carboxylesterase
MAATWQHNYITTNGVKLHYVTEGEGGLMLLLHGFPEFWYSWRYQIPAFADQYQVVAIDLRGYNESDKPAATEAYAMKELLKDVEGLIQGLGFDRCVLVGHDWGGAIAWHFAYAHPELVESLIIMNLPHPAKFLQGLRSPLQLIRSSYVFFFQLPWLPELVLQWNDYEFIDALFTGMAVNRSTFTAEDIEIYKDAAAKRGALTAMVNYYRNAWKALPEGEWGVLQVPTLLIWGEDDAVLGKELTYGTNVHVRDLQVKYIPRCSHWVQQEQPELVNQYMREFLSTEIQPKL